MTRPSTLVAVADGGSETADGASAEPTSSPDDPRPIFVPPGAGRVLDFQPELRGPTRIFDLRVK